MGNKLEELQEKLRAAQSALNDAKDAQNAEIRAATEQIKAKHECHIEAMAHALALANALLDDHLIVTASHPLLGKKVFKMEPIFHSAWAIKPYKIMRHEGVVIVFARDTPTRGNHCSVGDICVRYIKTDGTQGSRIERISDKWKEVQS